MDRIGNPASILLILSILSKTIFQEDISMPTGFPSLVNRRGFLQISAGMSLAAVFGRAGFVGAFQAQGESALKVHSKSPLNAEPELQNLVREWLTPVKQFYIRSHGNHPQIEAGSFRLKVEGLVEKPLELSLAELKERFKEHSTPATLTCAGNRREEFNKIKPVGGVQWGPGAIANAEWAGVRLSDVLKAAGLKEDAKHVWFEGLDEITEKGHTTPFGGSIPVTKALADENTSPGALLAFRMNGEPLSVDHGFPLRSLVPGYIGARSVKWLGKITVSNRPSPNHFVQEAYKLVTEDKPLAWDEAGVIYHYFINSAIAGPAPKGNGQPQKVRGYALPEGDGGHIAKVEVSANNGQTWTVAKLRTQPKPYCWVIWEADLQIPAGSSKIVVRATDSKGHSQPQHLSWNFKGYMNNAWHSLSIES